MKQVSEAAVDLGQNWIAYVMMALGVSATEFHELVGGLFFAIAAGSIMGRARRDPRKIWFIIVMAAFAGVLCAVIWPHIGWDLPVQFGMAAFGAASSWLVNIFVKVGDGVEARSDKVADQIIDKVLPNTKEGEK